MKKYLSINIKILNNQLRHAKAVNNKTLELSHFRNLGLILCFSAYFRTKVCQFSGKWKLNFVKGALAECSTAVPFFLV